MKLLVGLFISLFLVFCGFTGNKKTLQNFSVPVKKEVAEISLTDTLTPKIAQIDSLYRLAIKKIVLKDTSESVTIIEEMEEIFNDFSQEEQTALSENIDYVILAKNVASLKQELPAKFFNNEESDKTDQKDILAVREAISAIDEDSTSNDLDESTSTYNGYTIPAVMNRKVQNTLNYFTKRERGRRILKRWFERGSRYKKMIERILEEEGLPKDLYYLGMIESGYNPRARSWAAAVGPWQFIKATGRAYGLKSSYWADDRRDVENATRAAARHLKDLHKRFGNWYLAMAGYNCNPARIARRVRIQKTTDYFKLRYLPRETRGYVPNFIAAMMIGHNPEKYGIYFEEQDPIEYDRIYIKDAVDLNHIAKASNAEYKMIRDLNPAIYRWVTPSDRDSMYLNVPVGTGNQVLAYIDSLPDSQKQKFVRYRIRSGDALSLIAKKFNVRISTIRKMNRSKIKGNTIRVGHYLMIPQPMNSKYYAQAKQQYKSSNKKRTYKRSTRRYVNHDPNRKKIVYIVKSGDTLGHIAEDYGIRAQHIRNWNNMYYRQPIRVGQKLTLWLKDEQPKQFTPRQETLQTDKYAYHKVGRGETLSTIAKKYKLDVDTLKQLNGLTSNLIKRGKHLIVGEKGGR